MGVLEKRDIVEIAEEQGIDLTYHKGVDREYYQAFCPLHDNTKTPAFVIYPHVQRFYCYGCCPEGGDVIDLVRKKNGLSFKEAQKVCCYEITDEEALLKEIQAQPPTRPFDESFIQNRAMKVFDHPRKLNFQFAQNLLHKLDWLVNEGRWLEADRLLRKAGY